MNTMKKYRIKPMSGYISHSYYKVQRFYFGFWWITCSSWFDSAYKANEWIEETANPQIIVKK